MFRGFSAFVAALVIPGFAAAAGPFDSLLSAVPPGTNTLVLINVGEVYSSELARSEKWADEYFEKYRSGIGFVPPDGEAVVIASRVNLSSMVRDHQIGLVRVRVLPSIRALADREAGTVSTMAGVSVVNSPRDIYYTTLGGTTVAAVYPADRQSMAAWLRHATAAREPSLSPYLMGVVETNEKADVKIAVDLTDALDPALLAIGFEFSPAIVKQGGVNVAALARYVATARGMTFTADITDKIIGTVQIDFGADPTPFRRSIHELFLELLDEQGIAIPGMEKWEPTYGATSMTLSGPLEATDLRRILSLFAFPGATSQSDSKLKPGEITAAATRRYWAAVNTVLDDTRNLRERLKSGRDYTKMATWFEKAATQLEQLNRLGVDPIAVDVAAESAKRFRAISNSLRGVPIDVQAIGEKGYVYQTTNYGWPFWGGWWNWRAMALFSQRNVRTNFPELRGQAAKVIADDQKNRIEAWSQIDGLVSEARLKLSDKYKQSF
jgi:hypothetical protein